MLQSRRRGLHGPPTRVGAVMPTPWTPERDEKLRLLWERGDTCSEIGAQLGTTKSAIAGRARRQKLPPRPSPLKTKPAIVPAPKPRVARITQWRRAGESTPPLALPQHPVVAADLRRDIGGKFKHCQFIPGEPSGENTLYCGQPSHKNFPYCLRHLLTCYTPRAPRKKVLDHE